MTTSVIDAEFRLKLQSLRRELESVPGMTKKSAREAVSAWTAQWKEAERNSTSTFDKIKKDGGQLGKVAEMLGGQWGTALRMLKGGSELAADGMSSTAVAAGAAAVGIAAVVAVGSTFLDVMRNLDSYKDTIAHMVGAGLISQEDVAQLEKGSRALKSFQDVGSELAVFISAELAPTFSDFALGATYVITLLETWSMDKAAREARKFYNVVNDVNKELAKTPGDPLGIDSIPWEKKRELQKMLDEEDAKLAAAAAKRAAEAVERAKKVQQANTDALLATADLELYVDDVATQAAAAAEQAAQAMVEFGNAMAQSGNNGVTHIERIGDAMDAYNEASQAAHDGEVDRMRDESEKRKAALQEKLGQAQTWLSTTSQVTAAMGHLADTLTQREVDGTKEGTEAHTRAMRKQFAVSKAVALAQAAIGTAMAVVQALASLPPPASYALAAVSGAAGAVEIGLIAAQQPPAFHTGGTIRSPNRAPDEVHINALDGEGILNRGAVDRIGGPKGVDALNRGLGMNRPEVIAVPVYGHRLYDAVTAGALSRSGSNLSRAIRGARTARAGHRAYA